VTAANELAIHRAFEAAWMMFVEENGVVSGRSPA
jgi:hypothetical protein